MQEQKQKVTLEARLGVGDLFLKHSCYFVNTNTLSLPTQNVRPVPTSSHKSRPSVSVYTPWKQ